MLEFNLDQGLGGVPALSKLHKMKTPSVVAAAMQVLERVDETDAMTSEDGSANRRNTAMNWIASNWIWLALGVGALALFTFGRGGCGMGHGGSNHRQRGEGDQYDRPRETTSGLFSTPAARVSSGDTPLQPAGHVHGAPAANKAALATEHASHDSAAGQSEPHRHRHSC